MLSLDQINVDQPLILKELDWAEQGPLPSLSPPCPSWRQDVSLDCKFSPEDTQAHAWTTYYYDLLQCTLQQEGLPETVDRTKEPRTGCSSADIAICILGSPTSYLSVLLEGSSQCPVGCWSCEFDKKARPLGARIFWKDAVDSQALAGAPHPPWHSSQFHSSRTEL